MKRKFALLCALAVVPAAAAAAPAGLNNKSVVATISETRISRPVSGGPAGSISAQTNFMIYISSAGRPFVRSDRTVAHRGGAQQKAIDAAPGGTIGVGTASNVAFSGKSMIVTIAMTSGARRIVIDFDGSFSNCTGTVQNAKEGGKNMVIRNRYTGEQREVLSIQSTVTGCSVRSGNVFAGQ